MAWGSDTADSGLSNITTEQYFAAITLNPGELVHCQVLIEFPGTPTDHALVSVYTTLDTTSEVWDNIPFMQFRVLNSDDPDPTGAATVGFTISGLYKFQIGVKRDGSTDTITTADLNYRKDGVSL